MAPARRRAIAEENPGHRLAVERPRVGQVEFPDVQERRQVVAGDHRRGGLSGSDPSRPLDDARHPDSTLPDGALESAQAGLRLLPIVEPHRLREPVVGGEGHERVVLNAERAQVRAEATDLLVHRRDAGVVGLLVVVHLALFLGRVELVESRLVEAVGTVRGMEPDDGEEGALGGNGVVDEPHRLPDQDRGGVAGESGGVDVDVLLVAGPVVPADVIAFAREWTRWVDAHRLEGRQRLRGRPTAVVAVMPRRRIEVAAAPAEATAAAAREIVRVGFRCPVQVAEVPLAEVSGHIALGLGEFGDRQLQVAETVVVGHVDVVAARRAAGDEGRPGRTAVRTVRVHAVKLEAGRRHLAQLGRLDLAVARKDVAGGELLGVLDVAPALIVAHHENDVRPRRNRRRPGLLARGSGATAGYEAEDERARPVVAGAWDFPDHPAERSHQRLRGSAKATSSAVAAWSFASLPTALPPGLPPAGTTMYWRP